MANVTIIGLDKLEAKLKKNATLDDVRTVVKKHGSQMQKGMVERAPYKTGYLKSSIHGETRDDGLSYVAGPEAEYGIYQEYGTRKMASQPFVLPSFNEQVPKFKSDMEKLTK